VVGEADGANFWRQAVLTDLRNRDVSGILSAVFDYSPETGRVSYNINTMELPNSMSRKLVRRRNRFPSDTIALKVKFLSTMQALERCIWLFELRAGFQSTHRY